MIANERRTKLITGSRQPAGLCRIAKPKSWVGNRHDRGSHASTIHVFERLLGGPPCVGRLQKRLTANVCDPRGRGEMVMEVNPAPGASRFGALSGSQAGCDARREGRTDRQTEKRAPIDFRHRCCSKRTFPGRRAGATPPTVSCRAASVSVPKSRRSVNG